MSRILVYSSPAAGHVLPLVPGLRALSARGHDVHLRTDAANVRLVEAAGLQTSAQDPRIAAMRVTDHEAASGIDRLRRGLSELIGRGSLERADIERQIRELQPELLLIDGNAYGAATAAEASGLPWALTFPSLVPFRERGLPPYGFGLKPMGGPLGRLRDAAVWQLMLGAYSKAMLPGLNKLRAESGLEPLSSPVDYFLQGDLLLALTGPPLEYPRAAPPESLRFVGAQLWDPPATTPDWLLEPGDPWVLVTCSTEYQGDEALAAAAIEALRDEPVRVLVTMADAHGAELPSAPNARVEQFVPHGPLLERAAAVICHGGMGITQKAIGAGVPLVVVPFGRDQPEVARRVVECGAGVSLAMKKLTPQRLLASYHQAVAGIEGVLAASRRLDAGAGPERFADAAEELCRPTQAANRSMAELVRA
jgi:MGT family glycosyltransferase